MAYFKETPGDISRRENDRIERENREYRERERRSDSNERARERQEREKLTNQSREREHREALARQQREAESQRREQERLNRERQAAEARQRERERLDYERRVATEPEEKEIVAREYREFFARQQREAETQRREQERLHKERQAAEARQREWERLEYERRVATEPEEKEIVARERREFLARQKREMEAEKEQARLVQEMLESSRATELEQAQRREQERLHKERQAAEARQREWERLEYERRVATEPEEKEIVARERREFLARQKREMEAEKEQARLVREMLERNNIGTQRDQEQTDEALERERQRKKLLTRQQREAEAEKELARSVKEMLERNTSIKPDKNKSSDAGKVSIKPKTKPNSVSHNKPATSNVDTSKSTIRLSPAELQALAMEASYADFSEFDGKKVKEALADSKNFNSLRKAEAFVDNFTMLAQLPNSRHGSSAIILKNKHSGYIHWVARGTELTDIQDAITDARLTISGRPKYQELEQLNFYSRLSTPKNQPAPQYEYAKQYITGPNKMAMKVDNTDKIVLKKSTAPGLGVINKTDYIEFNGHSLAMSLGEGLRYVIPNPSKIYGANGAGLRQSSANKKFYEETRKLVSGSTTAIDWNKYNSSSTNTVTTGKPTIVASNTAVLPQNGSIQKLPQPINGTEGHRISHFTQSQITKVMVESIGLNYQEFVRKHQEAHNKQVIRERTNGTMRNEIHTLINHEKLAINRIARFLGNARRYTEPSGTETEKEAIDKNNKDLLMDLRLRTPLLDPKQKRQLQEILNKPVEPLELSKRGTTPTLNSNIARQTDSLIQAMAIANKGREGEVELTNLSASSDISLTFNHT